MFIIGMFHVMILSDHRMIRFAINCDKPAPIWCRNVKGTNWQLYEDELQESISLWFGQVETPADIERELNVLNTAVIKTFHKACPEHRVSSRNKVPRWNQELTTLKMEANRAYHKAYKSKSDQDWQAHKADRRAFKKEFHRSQRNTWRDFCTRTQSTPEAARLYTLLGKSDTCALGMLQLPSGQWANTL